MKYFILTYFIIIFYSCNKENKDLPITNLDHSYVDSIYCNNIKISGYGFKSEISNFLVTINYKGGNGGNFPAKSVASSGVTGLTAFIKSSNLQVGDGELNYEITGIPTSIGKASFIIMIGQKSCQFSININENPIIVTAASNIKDIDGNEYKTIMIGKQQWMAENLKVTRYNEGTKIQNIVSNSEWSVITSGAFCSYQNNTSNDLKNGKLYNWYAVDMIKNNNKNICPNGWHVPSDGEWTILTDYLGGSNSAGEKMKELGINNWMLTNNSRNYLFSALPSGMRLNDGYFNELNCSANWWSTTENFSNGAWQITINNNSEKVIRTNSNKNFGLSVRCVKN